MGQYGWFLVVVMLAQYWLMWLQAMFLKRMRRYTNHVLIEQKEAWAVLVECRKVLEQRDDFDSKHVIKLIQDLARKGIKPIDEFL